MTIVCTWFSIAKGKGGMPVPALSWVKTGHWNHKRRCSLPYPNQHASFVSEKGLLCGRLWPVKRPHVKNMVDLEDAPGHTSRRGLSVQNWWNFGLEVLHSMIMKGLKCFSSAGNALYGDQLITAKEERVRVGRGWLDRISVTGIILRPMLMTNVSPNSSLFNWSSMCFLKLYFKCE